MPLLMVVLSLAVRGLANGTVTVATGTAGRSIAFNTIDQGALNLTAGTGDIDFNAAVGNNAAIGVTTIVSAGNITADSTFESAGTDFTTTGILKLDGLLTTTGTTKLSSTGTGSLDINAGIQAFSQTVNLDGGSGGINTTGGGINTTGTAGAAGGLIV